MSDFSVVFFVSGEDGDEFPEAFSHLLDYELLVGLVDVAVHFLAARRHRPVQKSTRVSARAAVTRL